MRMAVATKPNDTALTELSKSLQCWSSLGRLRGAPIGGHPGRVWSSTTIVELKVKWFSPLKKREEKIRERMRMEKGLRVCLQHYRSRVGVGVLKACKLRDLRGKARGGACGVEVGVFAWF